MSAAEHPPLLTGEQVVAMAAIAGLTPVEFARRVVARINLTLPKDAQMANPEWTEPGDWGGDDEPKPDKLTIYSVYPVSLTISPRAGWCHAEDATDDARYLDWVAGTARASGSELVRFQERLNASMSGDTVAAPICTDSEAVEAVARAIERAECRGREGPYGGYDYGHGREFSLPECGRYVVRDFRDYASPEWGGWVHQTADLETHERAFKRLTEHHIAQAAIDAYRRAQPSATLGGVTGEQVRSAIKAAGDAPDPPAYFSGPWHDAIAAALSLQNATPDATRARETGE